MNKSAVISPCGRFRYLLSRCWDEGEPTIGFIMLNPSTADANVDDPTIRKCIHFAKMGGYGGIIVGNLSAYRATDSSDKRIWQDTGPENLKYLQAISRETSVVIAAWGAKAPEGSTRDVLATFSHLWCLGVTKHCHPRHPLYLKNSTAIEPWRFKL